MTAKEIYESIDLAQVPQDLATKLRQIEKATKGFTIQSDKIDTFLRGVYAKLKEKKPTALKNLKVEEKIVKKEVKKGKETQVVEELEYKVKGTKNVTKKTPTPSEPKRKENPQQEAKRTRKKGETAAAALTRVMQERKAAEKKADGVVAKTSEALKELEQMLQSDPKLAGYPRTYGNQSKRIDAKKDAQIKAMPAGKRVSKKGHKNQYGPSKGGRVYWENRDNRSDRFAPNFPNKVFLAVGGELDDLGFPHGETYIVVDVSPSGDKKIIKSTTDYLTAMMSAAVARSAKSSKDARVLIVGKDSKKVLHETFEAGGEITIMPYPLVDNPDALVGTTSMTELFECGGVTAYQEGGEVFVTPYPLTDAGSADYVAGSNTMSNMFEAGGEVNYSQDDMYDILNESYSLAQNLKDETTLAYIEKILDTLDDGNTLAQDDFRDILEEISDSATMNNGNENDLTNYVQRFAKGGKLPKNIKYYGIYEIKEYRLKNGDKIDPSQTFVDSGVYVSATKINEAQRERFQQKLEFKKGGSTNWKEDYIYIPRYEIEEVVLDEVLHDGKVIQGDYVVSGLYLPKSARTKMLEKEMKARMKKMETGGTIVAADPSAAMEDLNQTYGFESVYEKGGRLGFAGLARKVAKRYEGKAVPKKYQEEYGKTYSKAEALEVGRKVAAKVYRQQQAMMEAGGEITTPYPLTNAGSAEYVAGSNTMSNMFAKGGLTASEKNRLIEANNVMIADIDKYINSPMENSEKELRYREELRGQKAFLQAQNLHIQDSMMAKGGSLMGHGLSVGDKIVKDLGYVLKVANEDGDMVYVDLANGYRGAEPPLPFEHGGGVMIGDIAGLAKKYNKSGHEVVMKIGEGEKVEMEHTDNPKVARKIALDHIAEDWDYYAKLKKLGL